MNALTPAEILKHLPRENPTCFIDEILEMDSLRAVAIYTWKEKDCAGHFPGNPVVPGVKLVEMASQIGNLAWGIYHKSLKADVENRIGLIGVLSSVEKVIFKKMIVPGETVLATASLVSGAVFLEDRPSAFVEICFHGGPKDGESVFQGIVSGSWISEKR